MTRHITRDDSTDAKLGPNPSRRLTCVVLATAMALIAAFTSNGWTGDGTRAGDDGFEVAILAGGCFWGMEGLLRNLDGVVDTEVGYASDGNDKKATPAEATTAAPSTGRRSSCSTKDSVRSPERSGPKWTLPASGRTPS